MFLSEKERPRNFRNSEFFCLLFNSYFRTRWAKSQRNLDFSIYYRSKVNENVMSNAVWSSIKTKICLQNIRILDQMTELKARKNTESPIFILH